MNTWDRVALAKRRAANGVVRCKGSNSYPVDKRVTNGRGTCMVCGNTYTVSRVDRVVRAHYHGGTA